MPKNIIKNLILTKIGIFKSNYVPPVQSGKVLGDFKYLQADFMRRYVYALWTGYFSTLDILLNFRNLLCDL